jgi:hypothetical protein
MVNPVLMCYYVNMSISDIIGTVGMLMNGIESNGPIDPTLHADFFSELCEHNGLDFMHDSTEGIVFDSESVQVCYVRWSESGVDFEQHTYHPMTLPVIRLCLHTLQALEEDDQLQDLEEMSETEEQTVTMKEDDTTFDDDWI